MGEPTLAAYTTASLVHPYTVSKWSGPSSTPSVRLLRNIRLDHGGGSTRTSVVVVEPLVLPAK